MNNRKLFTKAGVIGALIFAAAYLDGRWAHGGLAVALALAGLVAAVQNKRGVVLSCFILFPVLQTLNPALFPAAPLGSIVNRVSMFVLALVMAVTATRSRGNNRLPLGGLLLYLAVAAVSSMQGYFPSISYAKLVNFAGFLMGIWLGTRNLQNSPKDLATLRLFMMGLCMFVILGSAATLPFPGYAYLNMRSTVMLEGAEAAAEAYAELTYDQGVALFAGVTNQSQCLGPMLAAVNMWIICDMLFVVKKFEYLHAGLALLGLVLMAYTHSRTSMLSFACGMAVLLFYALRRVRMPERTRQQLKRTVYLGMMLFIAWAVQAEVRHGEITRWLLKFDTDQSHENMGQRLTASRQGLVEQNWADFHYNEIWGCGFQVAWNHQYLYGGHEGLILSAPIEKGVLPLMVLGEGGVVGAIVFGMFIILFYAGCVRSRHYATMMLFTVMLGSNMGEADFFSPGGIGGAKWVLCVVGGFLIDTLLLYDRKMAYAMPMAWRRW